MGVHDISLRVEGILIFWIMNFYKLIELNKESFKFTISYLLVYFMCFIFSLFQMEISDTN